jgi:hypothetical protein
MSDQKVLNVPISAQSYDEMGMQVVAAAYRLVPEKSRTIFLSAVMVAANAFLLGVEDPEFVISFHEAAIREIESGDPLILSVTGGH